jgi:hypothetical protein
VNISDYLPSDRPESCLTTEVPSSVLKLKADNNPWNCCEMKDLFDYISNSVLILPNLTCKWPSEYENKHWEVLKNADCSTTIAPTLIRMTEESTSVSVTSSSDRNSAIPKGIEKPATKDVGLLSADSSLAMLIVIVTLSVTVIVLLVLVIGLSYFLCVRKTRSNYFPMKRLDNQRPETDENEQLQMNEAGASHS